MRVGCLSPSLPVRPCRGSAAGAAPSDIAATVEPMEEQLRRTVVALSPVAMALGRQHSRTSNCQNHLFGGTQPCTLRCSPAAASPRAVRPARRNHCVRDIPCGCLAGSPHRFLYALTFALIGGTIVGAYLLGGHLAIMHWVMAAAAAGGIVVIGTLLSAAFSRPQPLPDSTSHPKTRPNCGHSSPGSPRPPTQPALRKSAWSPMSMPLSARTRGSLG